jgi:hypothetical protein
MREPRKFESEGRKRETWRGKGSREMIVTLRGRFGLFNLEKKAIFEP